MAWDDDATQLGAEITGTEWNTMASVINAKADTHSETFTGTTTIDSLSASGNISTTANLSASNGTFTGDVISDDIIPNSSSSGVSIKNKNGVAVATFGAGSSSSLNGSYAGNLAVTGNLTVSEVSSSGKMELNNNNVTEIKQACFNGIIDDGNSSTADTIDFSAGSIHKSTLTGNCTYTFTAPTGVSRVQLLIYTGAGSYAVTWPASVKWTGGTAPTITTTASKVDIVTFVYDGTNYFGSISQNYSA